MSMQRGQTPRGLQENGPQVDADTRNPLHDEIMAWVDAHITDVLGEVYGKSWDEDLILDLRSDADRAVANSLAALDDCETLTAKMRELKAQLDTWSGLGGIPKFSDYQIWDITWFAAIHASAPGDTKKSSLDSPKTPFVGFVDLAVTFGKPILELRKEGIELYEGNRRPPVRVDGNRIIPPVLHSKFIQEPPKLESFYKAMKALIDVRAEISSLGEVIQQIRWIQLHDERPFIVVSPEARWENQLRSQGIAFVRYAG